MMSTPPEPKSGGEQIETITTTHSPETMRASSHPRQRGAGRRRGRLVRDSGEPGELADAEEDWSEAQGSQGSYLARALRKSEGWCCLRLDRGEIPCMVSDPLAESGHQQRYNFFRGECVKYLWYTTSRRCGHVGLTHSTLPGNVDTDMHIRIFVRMKTEEGTGIGYPVSV